MPNLVLATLLIVSSTTPLDWTETPTEVPAGLLYSIDSAAHATWAVGTALQGPDNAFHSLALRYDGTEWTPTAQPEPEGRLLDVAVRGSNDVWAVGERSVEDRNGTKPAPLIQHWNGRSWTAVPMTVPDMDQGGLTAVATTGRGTWAAGWSYSDQSGGRAVVYRRDWTGWRSMTDRTGSGLGYVNDILPLADDNVWTANSYGIGHYDGRRWKKVDLPGDDTKIVVMNMAATGPNDIWAAGLREDPQLWRRPLILHYDGVRWTEVPTPAESAQLNAIELVDGEPVAVGERGLASYVLRGTAGTGFERAETPPRSAGLLGTASGGGRLWAVGVAEWNGRQYEPYAAVSSR